MAEGRRGAKRRIKAAERRIMALELRKQGKSYRQIAEALGCNSTTAFKDIQFGMAEYAKKQDNAASGLVEYFDEQYLMAQDSIYEKMKSGDLDAVNTWARIVSDRVKLRGLGGHTDIQVNNNTIVLDWGEPALMAEIPDIIDIEPEAYNRLPAPEAAPDAQPVELPANPIQAEVQRLNARYGVN